MEKQYQYGILGGGSWATAIAKILTNNGNHIHWWIRDEQNIAFFKKRKHNPHYVSNIYFDLEKIHFSNQAAEIIKAVDVIIIAIPSAYVEAVLKQLPKNVFENKLIISAIKGIIPPNNILLNDLLEQYFTINIDTQYGIIGGPCHAEEVSAEKLSYLTLGSSNETVANKYAAAFKTEYINTVVNTDVMGIQYAAVLKNIYAIGAGIAHGLDYGDNFMSVFIANAANEMAGFLRCCNTKHAGINYAASVYLGDLLVTCYSLHSRNRSFGNYIGKGYSVKNAQLEMNMVAEGYNASKGIYEINNTIKGNLPIATTIYQILWEGLQAKVGFEQIEKFLV
jgi:glycerol-3-phosphate dehydrogenase (NAD(P)+)